MKNINDILKEDNTVKNAKYVVYIDFYKGLSLTDENNYNSYTRNTRAIISLSKDFLFDTKNLENNILNYLENYFDIQDFQVTFKL